MRLNIIFVPRVVDVGVHSWLVDTLLSLNYNSIFISLNRFTFCFTFFSYDFFQTYTFSL
jgi:hypothetical protein